MNAWHDVIEEQGQMVARIWTKKETQATVKALRKAGYTIPPKGNTGMYQTEEEHEPGRKVFVAMVGTRGYLVRYWDGLFQEEEE
jgi:hypothetical protein